jgi:hypothetical protein
MGDGKMGKEMGIIISNGKTKSYNGSVMPWKSLMGKWECLNGNLRGNFLMGKIFFSQVLIEYGLTYGNP